VQSSPIGARQGLVGDLADQDVPEGIRVSAAGANQVLVQQLVGDRSQGSAALEEAVMLIDKTLRKG